jgi:hypothetical protein
MMRLTAQDDEILETTKYAKYTKRGTLKSVQQWTDTEHARGDALF